MITVQDGDLIKGTMQRNILSIPLQHSDIRTVLHVVEQTAALCICDFGEFYERGLSGNLKCSNSIFTSALAAW